MSIRGNSRTRPVALRANGLTAAPWSGVVALVATSADGKASIVVGVTPDLTKRFSAVDLVRKASEVLGGKGGGGKPEMAQAGGPDGSKAEAALRAIEGALSSE